MDSEPPWHAAPWGPDPVVMWGFFACSEGDVRKAAGGRPDGAGQGEVGAED